MVREQMRRVSVHSSIKHEEVWERAYQSTRFGLTSGLLVSLGRRRLNCRSDLHATILPQTAQSFCSRPVQPSRMGSGSFKGMLEGGSRYGVSESQDRRGNSWKWSDNLHLVLVVMAINVDSQSYESKVCREFLCRYLIVNAVGQPIVEGIE